jgi:hypothetical protein
VLIIIFKKIITIFLALVFAGVVLPAGAAAVVITNPAADSDKKPYYNSFTGTVKSIGIFPGTNLSSPHFIHVLAEDTAGDLVNFIISNDTIFTDNTSIAAGTTITGFYTTNRPAIMIFPPQYFADIVATDTAGKNIKADLFDENLISRDNSLKLNISDTTQILLPNGNTYTGSLANKKLFVIYDISTRSIPAQTTPLKIIVLDASTEKIKKPRIKTRI